MESVVNLPVRSDTGTAITSTGGTGLARLNCSSSKKVKILYRVCQMVLAALAFESTLSFHTRAVVLVTCLEENSSEQPTNMLWSTISYSIGYPFAFESTTIEEKYNCTKNAPLIEQAFPMDNHVSSSAQFFVTIGVLSLVYSGAAVIFYSTRGQQYATDPMLPVIDLVFTVILTFFWIAGTCEWAFAVSNLKHYTSLRYLNGYIHICKGASAFCFEEEPANWRPLDFSLLCAVKNAIVWLISCCSIFKETPFHKKSTVSRHPPESDQTVPVATDVWPRDASCDLETSERSLIPSKWLR